MRDLTVFPAMLWTWGGHTMLTIGGAPVFLFGLGLILFGIGGAVGVGLGLQNVFSNLVSGAILNLWAIETEMRKRDVEIPFPQRDLPLRSGTLHAAIDRMPECWRSRGCPSHG